MISAFNDGLNVIFDGGKNRIIPDADGLFYNNISYNTFSFGEKKEKLSDVKSIRYETGAMMCELMRFSPEVFKMILLLCPHFEEKITSDFYMTDDAYLKECMDFLHDMMQKTYPPVIFNIVYSLIARNVESFVRLSDVQCKNLFSDIALTDAEKVNLKKIFNRTPFSDFSGRYIGQALLFGYYSVETNFQLFSYLFNQVIKVMDDFSDKKAEGKRLPDELDALYTTQDIGFKIVNINGKLNSVYIIRDAVSLLAFEASHVFEQKKSFVKCKNCGYYFVPDKRTDTLYCSYASLQAKDKTCKEIGARITRAKKEKTDEPTRKYRKVYMKYKMRLKRHPDDSKLLDESRVFFSEAKEMCRLLKDGEITENYFFEWLNKYDI